jgi:hypothetical protein
MKTTARRAMARPLPALLLTGCLVVAAFGGRVHSKPVDRITVRGTATLDGAPLDADFLGAVVHRDGMVTPCQSGIPSVSSGRYVIRVLAEGAARGCGRRGAEILLWTFVGETKLYSTDAVKWPPRGNTVRFNPQFSTATPHGAVPPVTELSGEVFDRDGRRLPPGTRVEAFIGSTRCGIASVRRAESFVGYVLSVVGPESVSGCDRDAQITFMVNGRPANETTVNHLTGGTPGSGGSFRLTLS